MKMRNGVIVATAALLALTFSQEARAAQAISYSEDILPIFKGRCVSCHAPGTPEFEQSGLDLTSWQGLMKGTRHGPIVVRGDPETSNLVWLLDGRASHKIDMPLARKKLSTCDRNAIRTWIRQGAKQN